MQKFFRSDRKTEIIINTFSVVGVVGVLVANSGSLRMGQSAKFKEPPVLFLSEQSRMSTLSVQKKLSEKATYNFEKFGKTPSQVNNEN